MADVGLGIALDIAPDVADLALDLLGIMSLYREQFRLVA